MENDSVCGFAFPGKTGFDAGPEFLRVCNAPGV